VHADDWVPRLSALALDRLERDARAREWAEAKRRLALLPALPRRRAKQAKQ
jgi:hypothetical protein